MQLLINLNQRDSVKVCESLNEIDQIKLKNLNQKERAICFVALKNCIFERKMNSAQSLPGRAFKEINQKLKQENPFGLSLVGKAIHPILSLVKGIFNLIGFRVSSSQLHQLNTQYQEAKVKQEEFLKQIPDLIQTEEQKITRLKKEMEGLKNSGKSEKGAKIYSRETRRSIKSTEIEIKAAEKAIVDLQKNQKVLEEKMDLRQKLSKKTLRNVK